MINNSTDSSASALQTAPPFTLYRDVSLSRAGTRDNLPVRAALPRLTLPVQAVAERALFTALALLTLPAVAYSSAQLWKLISSNALEHAVLSFMP